jgi:hypothetical protein
MLPAEAASTPITVRNSMHVLIRAMRHFDAFSGDVPEDQLWAIEIPNTTIPTTSDQNAFT